MSRRSRAASAAFPASIIKPLPPPSPPSRCLVAGWFPLLLAVPPLQRSQLEPEGRLLPRRLPHDVRHAPGHVQAGGPAPQLGSDRLVGLGARARRHHVGLPGLLVTHQPVHLLPGGPLLSQSGPRQRPQALLLQPVAPAHAAAAGAHLQEAQQESGGSGAVSPHTACQLVSTETVYFQPQGSFRVFRGTLAEELLYRKHTNS